MQILIALLAVVGALVILVLFWVFAWILWGEIKWRILARLGGNGQRERDRAAGRRP